MKRALYLFSLVVVSGSVVAADSGLELLRKMSDAMGASHYSGTFVYRHKDKVETLRIVHGNTSEGVNERLITISGKPREIIRNDKVVTCVWPDSKLVIVNESQARSQFPGLVPEDMSKLARFYDVEVQQEAERVAGRNCYIVDVRPKDKFRYGYRLWVDQDTHLLVRSDLINEDNEPVEQVMFTELEVHEKPPLDALQPELSTEGYERREIEQATAEVEGESIWKPVSLPEGFAMQDRRQRLNKAGTAIVEQLIYSDGLASVSVFIEPNAEKMLHGSKRRGALNVYGKMLGNFHITVVGEVPKQTVQLIAESVEQKQPD